MLSQIAIIALIAALVIISYLWLTAWTRRDLEKRGIETSQREKVVFLWGRYSPVFTWIKNVNWPHLKMPAWQAPRWRQPTSSSAWWTLGEIGLIVLWALFTGRRFLDFSPQVWIYGSDYPLHLQNLFIWETFRECGMCVFWNGTVNGGAPAFADLFGGLMHPLVILATLLWGVINGSKVILVGSFAMAGLGQWWLARVMGLGLVARIWVAMMAISAGNLAGRLDMGHIILVLSIASTTLILAPAIELVLTGRRRSAVWLGVMGAMALVSGHGYMQLAVLFGIAPAFLILLLDGKRRTRHNFILLLLAGGLAILLSAVYWLPLLRFLPNVFKSGDAYFGGSQPIQFIPLNLIINQYEFFTNELLGKKPFPAHYINYIGWVPLIFVLFLIRLVPRRGLRMLFFFLTGIGLIYLSASGLTFKWLSPYIDYLIHARHPSVIAALAVPLILAMAAWGLYLLLRVAHYKVHLSSPSGTSIAVDLAQVGVAIGMIIAVAQVYSFSLYWGVTQVPENRVHASRAVENDFAGWVAYPPGDLQFIPLALAQGLKITVDSGHQNWSWADRTLPPASLEMRFDEAATRLPEYTQSVDGIHFVAYPQNHYAFVDTGEAQVPCTAQAQGGEIDVTCDTPDAGRLVVYENAWDGWRASLAGQPVPLLNTDWLSIDVPAGEHQVSFRYQPWDAWLGLVLTMAGIAACIWLMLLPEGEILPDRTLELTEAEQDVHETPQPERREAPISPAQNSKRSLPVPVAETGSSGDSQTGAPMAHVEVFLEVVEGTQTRLVVHATEEDGDSPEQGDQ